MKKTFVILVSAFLLLGCLSFASAINLTGNVTGELSTPQTNFTISPGEIMVSDFSIEEIEPSSALGGLISSLSFYYERYLDFVGLRVWKDFSTTSPEFELMAFPAGSVLGENIVQGELFMPSEPVILEDTTTEHTWLTYHTDASWGNGADFQTLAGLDQTMATSGGNLKVVSINGNVNFVIDGTTFSKSIEECTPTLCPSETDLFAFGLVYEVDYDSILTFNNDFNVGRVLILELDNVLTGFLIDKNCDTQWNFMENVVQGFSVDSFENHVIAILSEGSYDVYTIF